jgi:hypothetical protein
MNEILHITEILGTVAMPEGECELIARATAEYNEGSGNLLVRLEASVRRRNAARGDSLVAATWLPENQTASEFAPIEEASEIARDIFRRWVRKVRSAAPSLHQPTFT